ncbi:MerR family transcriptional regulator [Saccharothrix algeriensis]|uniref:DNA-binding transcriptional MerR regulator n=1 Tax=Saccharothrix algeriensis TaxID=173560 RepID=A0ABS2SFU6_9PSEU|nr:MerR family transcriptional regulator [Saccharothrix algeriensis]MBM7815135.1 DNA-binding transcriptional MerR regulator [Saccharothrix algeriensis]
MDDELWTIEQLPEQVAALLAENYGGQRNGRVRELPNGRAIRWYTTIGLVDRPVAGRGRTAWYGRRHVLQLVAVKKLQAAGHSLAEVQALLLGASDAKLAELAGAGDVPARAAGSRGEGFWRERPAAAPTGGEPAQAAPAPTGGESARSVESAAVPAGGEPARSAGSAAAQVGVEPAPSASDRPAARAARSAGAVTAVPALRLTDGVTLVLGAAERLPDPRELAELRAAAAPLLDLLTRLGLAPTTGEDDQ